MRVPLGSAATSSAAPSASATAVLLAAALVAGCAALAPPKPPPYTGADTVDEVSSDAFVGDWRMVALNPIEGEEVPERRISYAPDGTFAGEIEPTADMAEVTGPEPIRMSGTWSVADGRLRHDTTEVAMPGDDAVSRLASRTMRGAPTIAAEAEIYEAGAERIVVVSEEGYANAFERL